MLIMGSDDLLLAKCSLEPLSSLPRCRARESGKTRVEPRKVSEPSRQKNIGLGHQARQSFRPCIGGCAGKDRRCDPNGWSQDLRLHEAVGARAEARAVDGHEHAVE